MSHTSRWTAQKISQRIKLIEPLVYREKQPLPPYQILQYNDAQATSVVPPDIENGDWETIRPNEYWGGRNISFTLRTQFKIPADWRAETPIALSLPIGDAGDFSHPEAMVFIDGTPYAACDRHHQEVILGEEFKRGQTHQLVLHGWSGINLPDYQRLQMNPCYLVNIDQPTRDFIVMSRVALGAAEILDADEPAKGFLLNALDDAFKSLDTREPFGDAFYQSVLEAYAVLKNGIVRSGRSLEVEIFAVGHAHIDVAWLWTLDQTRGKAGRTFYNVIRLMEQFPHYHFTQSQPQLYDFIRQDYPSLFEHIKGKVADGKWEPIGGMWVEADCNISSGESLVRQFLLGRGFYHQHFGASAESPVLWLPDVFGYAWNLPQIMAKAGIEFFFTTKIGWNQYNRLPYDSFWWQGLDGTRVITHMSTSPGYDESTVSTYNAGATRIFRTSC
jgi:alpha-mannosidase